MSDQLERFIFSEHDIRGQLVTLSRSYQEVLEHNDLPQPVQHLLGEFLAAACLLSTTLKFEGILMLQARGEGDVPLLVAECTHHSDVREKRFEMVLAVITSTKATTALNRPAAAARSYCPPCRP